MLQSKASRSASVSNAKQLAVRPARMLPAAVASSYSIRTGNAPVHPDAGMLLNDATDEWRRYGRGGVTITAMGGMTSVGAEPICTEATSVYVRLALYACLSGKVDGKERGLMCQRGTSPTGQMARFESLARYQIPRRLAGQAGLASRLFAVIRLLALNPARRENPFKPPSRRRHDFHL